MSVARPSMLLLGLFAAGCLSDPRASTSSDAGPPVVLDVDASEPDPSCVPTCGARTCGDDGCGGVCGVCPAGSTCAAGACALGSSDAGSSDAGSRDAGTSDPGSSDAGPATVVDAGPGPADAGDDGGGVIPSPRCSGGTPPYTGMSVPEMIAETVYTADIAVDCAGVPWIAYVSDTGDRDMIVLRWSASGWTSQAIIPLTYAGPLELEVGTDGVPRIAYYDNGALRYAEGPSFAPVTVDGIGLAARQLSLALDASDSPHIAYTSGDDALYAHRAGALWRTEVALSRVDETIEEVAIALGPSGRPTIVAPVADYSRWTIHVAERSAAGAWSDAPILAGTEDTPLEQVGRHLDAVWDGAGTLQIALASSDGYYYGSSPGYHTSWSAGDATPPERLTDAYGNVHEVRAAVDAQGDVHVLFGGLRGVTHGTRRAGGAFVTREVTGARLDGDDYPSSNAGMAIDPFGGIHIAYISGGSFSTVPNQLVFVRLID